MNIFDHDVKFSSIVAIGEKVSKLEKETNQTYLKLHRGVMDVGIIDLSFIDLDLNSKSLQQYGGNDGDPSLINSIKSVYGLESHQVIICPGGMATLDIVLSSLSDDICWVPMYHWGSWNKILKTYGFSQYGKEKKIKTFDDFDLDNFKPDKGIVMLCYPSNPLGWIPDISKLSKFIRYCKDKNITVILDLPYYHLFFDSKSINHLFFDNVIVLSSFSKSVGLSGYRIGYVATLNSDLYKILRTRSLYKYNSISNLPQVIINKIISTHEGQDRLSKYKNITISAIDKNIDFLKRNNLIWDNYPSDPIGPFCIINRSFNDLISFNISSVPLSNFTLDGGTLEEINLSRISLAVDSSKFVQYFERVLEYNLGANLKSE